MSDTPDTTRPNHRRRNHEPARVNDEYAQPKKKFFKRGSVKWAFRAAAAVGITYVVAPQVLTNTVDYIKQEVTEVMIMTSFPSNPAPGTIVKPDSDKMHAAGRALSAVYDDQLSITLNNRQVTRGPLYANLEKLSGDLGQTAAYQRYSQDMEVEWIGRNNTGSYNGGIWMSQFNPEGKLGTISNPDMLNSKTGKLEILTDRFITLLQGANGYADAVKKYDDVNTFVSQRPERQNQYRVMNNLAPAGNIADARRVVGNDSALKDFVTLMATDANTPSPSFQAMTAVVGELNRRQQPRNFTTGGLGSMLSEGSSDRNRVCSAAAAWRNMDRYMRNATRDRDGKMVVDPVYTAAVQAVQGKAATGVNIAKLLDDARDISTRVADAGQRRYGVSCNLGL